MAWKFSASSPDDCLRSKRLLFTGDFEGAQRPFSKIRVMQRQAYGLRDAEYLKFKIVASGLPPLEKPSHINHPKTG